MKRIISIMLIAVFAITTVVLTGCGESENITTLAEPDYTDSEGVGYSVKDDGTLEVSKSNDKEDVTIPSELNNMTVTSVAKNAFKMSDVKTVTLPDTVTEIQDRAFAFCTSLEEINIPEGVKTIGMNVFSGCFALTSIEFPSTLKSIGQFAFNSASLVSVTIPESVTLIDEYAFAQCTKLEEITILSKYTVISDTTFNEVYDLTIKAPKNSTAHKFAKNNDINFEAI